MQKSLDSKNESTQNAWEKVISRIKLFFYNISVRLKRKDNDGKVGKKVNRRVREKIFYWSIVILPLVHFLIFYVLVNLNSVLLAFKEYTVDANGVNSYQWAAFKNFKVIIDDFIYGKRLKIIGLNSLVVYFFNLVAGVPLALTFSYYLFKKCRFTGFFRIMLYLPSIISSVVTVMMYKFLVDRGCMEFMKIFGKDIMPPLSENNLVLGFVIFYNVLTGFGVSSIMYSSAMSRIDDSLLESAALDGASPAREFFSIVLPLIYPTIVTFLVVGIAGLFINQANLFTFFASEASVNTQTFGYYMFLMVSKKSNAEYPMAAAIGLIFTLFAAPLTLLFKKLLERFDPQVEY